MARVGIWPIPGVSWRWSVALACARPPPEGEAVSQVTGPKAESIELSTESGTMVTTDQPSSMTYWRQSSGMTNA
jgi:hypothetical protein